MSTNAKPRFDHGNADLDEQDRRLRLHWKLADPYTETAIMPPLVKADLDYVPFLEELAKDTPRRLQAAQLIASQHEDRHFFYLHPFCTECRNDDQAVHRSLIRWMALNPGRNVPLGDEEVPARGGEAPKLRLVEQDPDDVVIPFAPTCWFETDTPGGRKTFLSVDDLENLPPAKMHVAEVLPYGAHGIVSGRDGTFKTFGTIDLALCMATGLPWFGREAQEGRVLLLAGEGVHQYGRRFAAWQEARGLDFDEEDRGNIRVRNGTVDMHGGTAEYAELLAFVKEYRPSLIVIDTLQRSSGGADQNSASDMAVLTERAAQLRAAGEEGCTTIFVAHTDKGNNDTRGSSAIEDDSDFVLRFDRKGKELAVEIVVAKMKDGRDGQKIELGVVPLAGSLALVEKSAAPPVDEGETAYEKVRAVLRMHGRTLDPMPQTEILRQLPEFGGDFNRSTVSRALAKLVEDGVVEQLGGSGRLSKYRIHKDHVARGDQRRAPGQEN